MMRPTTSIGPPAAKGTTMVTGRVGQRLGVGERGNEGEDESESGAAEHRVVSLHAHHMQRARLPSCATHQRHARPCAEHPELTKARPSDKSDGRDKPGHDA